MTLAYLEAYSGISGDMTLGAMVDAGLDVETLRSQLARLSVDGYTLLSEKTKRKGIAATKVTVRLEQGAHTGHRHYPQIMDIIKRSDLDPKVKEIASAIFTTLGLAEAAVHNTTLEKVHFHEVGAVDSIVDIVGAAIGFCALGIDEVVVSAVNTGHGTVATEHGLLPVPAPATARILMGVPTYASGPAVELTTPTGASIVKTMGAAFGPQPSMTVRLLGCGAGGKELEDRPNILRLFIGERSSLLARERLLEISTNIDDMNPQGYPGLSDKLFAGGALDVTLAPVLMKKGRPAHILTVLINPKDRMVVEKIILEDTTSLGLRIVEVERVSAQRRMVEVQTSCGPVLVKLAALPGGGEKAAPEFESVRVAAAATNTPYDTLYWEAARLALRQGR
ncbi:MAG: nickel pincer cofactor biosynthesis protein LarC [Nitrospinota bacterium]|nr:nickel pincer cofactor biosynthesis protein LarC [Nitrospinota bacterium]MDH5757406.1 nickel pincer cofactor biosynthesis protein LarC [Nitrospinota bacterium]